MKKKLDPVGVSIVLAALAGVVVLAIIGGWWALPLGVTLILLGSRPVKGNDYWLWHYRERE